MKEFMMEKRCTLKVVKGLLFVILALLLAGSLVNCGGRKSSPTLVKAPTDFIKDFIAKHETMIDSSLVNFYVKEEQPIVEARINKTIEEKKEAGVLEKLQNLQFDFSNLQIKVVDQKEEYINDTPKKLIRVAVTGSYVMKQDDGAKTVSADDTIILEMVDNSWKVTEKINPWKEYHYKNKG